MNKTKYFFITDIIILFSLFLGVMTDDLIIGGSILATGLMCSYFACEGKRINYILSLINYILMGYVSFKNGLYGLFFFDIFIFSPLEIIGFITWKKNLDSNKNVLIREFTFKTSIIVTISCIVGSVVLGSLLSFIPGQRLALMDACSNCINFFGTVLMICRFKESWWMLLLNNLVDLLIWAILFINGGENSVMMLSVSIGFLLINIYGIMKWNFEARRIIPLSQYKKYFC